MSITAMKQALAVLENKCDPAHEAIASLRQAIAEAEKQEQDEPFAWFHYKDFSMIYHNVWEELIDGHDDWVPLYTKPQPSQKQEQDEPVAWMKPDALCDRSCMYACTEGFTKFPECATTPQPSQKPWVGLTDVEWMNIVNKDQAWFGQRPDEVAHEVAKLVEAKLKEKNT